MKTAVAVAVLTMLLAPAASAQTAQVPRPPDAFLASSSGEVKAEIQAYCWTEPDEGGGFIGVCADNFNPIDPAQAVVVDQGDLLTLRFDRPIRPHSISVSRRETSTSPPIETFNVPADNPTEFRAEFPPGTHIITMFTRWPQGDASYVFEVTVRPFQPHLGVLTPEIVDALARLTEAARGLGVGEGLFEQQMAALLASTAALTTALRNMVNALLGGQAGVVAPGFPGLGTIVQSTYR